MKWFVMRHPSRELEFHLGAGQSLRLAGITPLFGDRRTPKFPDDDH